MHWRADTRHWHATIEKILADERDSANDQGMKSQRLQLALFERDFIAATRAVAALPEEGMDGLSRDFWMGLIARVKGDLGAAQAAFTAARAKQEVAVTAARARQPDYAQALSTLGMIDAGLGAKKRPCAKAGRRWNSRQSQRTRPTVRGFCSTWHSSTRGLANAIWPSSNSKQLRRFQADQPTVYCGWTRCGTLSAAIRVSKQ